MTDKKCKTCGGWGLIARIRPPRDEVKRMPINPQYTQTGCPTCQGTGKQPKEADDVDCIS